MLTNKLSRLAKVHIQEMGKDDLGELKNTSLTFLKKVYTQIIPLNKEKDTQNNENDIVKIKYKLIIRKKAIKMNYDLVFEIENEFYDVDYWNIDYKNNDFIEIVVSKKENV